MEREVKRAKRSAGEELGKKISKKFKERNEMFWKKVNKAREGGKSGSRE